MNKHTYAAIIQDLKDKTLVILGLGREGLSTYTFLRSHLPGSNIVLVDQKPQAELSSEWHNLINSDNNTSYYEHISKPFIDLAIIFKSPGISPHSNFYQSVLKQFSNATISSNTNLFLHLLKDEAFIIGVTGTKGKSTTTSVIYHVLKETSNQPIFLGGNIGVPPLDLIPQIEGITNKQSKLQDTSTKPIIVLELSSHQLLNLEMSPHVAVVQEIVPEHLDYYQDFAEYLAAKSRIAQFQTPNDVVIYNSDYPTSASVAQQSLGTKIDIAMIRNTADVLKLGENSSKPLSLNKSILFYLKEEIIDISTLQIKGEHNILNILPAVVLSHYLDIPSDRIASALHTFKPLHHRLELVATIHSVEYYNDSLATTPEACIAALSAFSNKNIVLIAGGYDRHLHFTELAKKILDSRVTALILFKPTGIFIANELSKITSDTSKLPPIIFVDSMNEAVRLATKYVEAESVVLMSPAAASFGLFKDYADRGEQFIQAVLDLKSEP